MHRSCRKANKLLCFAGDVSNPYPPAPYGPPAAPPATPGPAELAAPKEKPGLIAGLKAFLDGCGWIMGNTSVWGLALVPITLAFVVTSVFGGLALWKIPAIVESLMGDGGTAHGVLTVALQVIATLIAVVLATVLGFGVAQTLSGPALEGLVRHREKALGLPERPPTPFLVDVWRSLLSALLGLAFGLPVLAILFVVELFAPYAVIITVPLKVLVMATVIGWDVCDYPLSVRGVPIGDRMTFMWRNMRCVLGFSVGLVLLSLVPCALLLALPAGVAGATRLVRDIEQWERNPRYLPG